MSDYLVERDRAQYRASVGPYEFNEEEEVEDDDICEESEPDEDEDDF